MFCVMIATVVIIIIGFVLLIKGADWLVSGASALAKKHNVSDLVIGLTIVAFGTSTPELVVNVVASLGQHSEIVLGNIIGSNIANLFLILGVAGLTYPIVVHSNTVWKEIPISFFSVLILFVLSNGFILRGNNILSRFDGLVMFLMFCGFLIYIYRQMKIERAENNESTIHKMPGTKIWVFIILGLAGLIAGGELVVDSAVKIASALGVSEKIIGLTIIAVGTSLPELMTSVVAALKKNSDIALGNVIGSNIFNILLILSVSSFIHPVNYDTSFNTELYILMAGTLILFAAMFTGGKKRLDRWEALILLLGYLVYVTFLILKEV